MSKVDTCLPPGFEALEPFVERWAVAGASRRAELRRASSPEEREAFYAATKALATAALATLDAKPFDRFDEKEQQLMNLMLAFAHVAVAVEVQRDQESGHAEASRHMKITRASADAAGSPEMP
jgi:hypothetical protein